MMFEFKIYQNEKFLTIIEDVYNIERIKLFDNDDLNSITTFFKSNIIKSDIFNMPFNFYYSPIINHEYQREFFLNLSDFSKKTNTNIIIKSLQNYSYGKKQLYAYNPILYLKNNYKNNYSKNLIKNIKRNNNKAIKNGIQIYKTNNIKDVIEFYNNVLSATYIDKHKMLFQPLKLFINLFKNNFIDVFIAKQNKKIIGGLCCMKDNKTYHYNWGASLNINNIALSTLLINFAIDYAFDKNYEIFDFGSTSLSDNQLLDFKLKWGTEKIEVYEYYTLNEPKQVDLNSSYLFIRNIYSKFPKFFLRWLVPKVIPYLIR